MAKGMGKLLTYAIGGVILVGGAYIAYQHFVVNAPPPAAPASYGYYGSSLNNTNRLITA